MSFLILHRVDSKNAENLHNRHQGVEEGIERSVA